jgi:hypothetical protein
MYRGTCGMQNVGMKDGAVRVENGSQVAMNHSFLTCTDPCFYRWLPRHNNQLACSRPGFGAARCFMLASTCNQRECTYAQHT